MQHAASLVGSTSQDMHRRTKVRLRPLPKLVPTALGARGSATADSNRAKRPALSEPSTSEQELIPCDRVVGMVMEERDSTSLG
jgi:hypothetical protein